MKQTFDGLMSRLVFSAPPQLPDQFEEALICAATPAECWTAILSAAPMLGVSRIQLELGGHSFDWRSAETPARSWEVAYDLSPAARIRLEKSNLSKLTPFVDTLRRTLGPKLPIFETAARKR